MKYQSSISLPPIFMLIVLTIWLCACQTQEILSLPSSNPDNAAIKEVLSHEYENFHIDTHSVRTFFTEEVGDWVLVGVQYNAETHNSSGGPIERVSCISFTKSTKNWTGWKAASGDSLCSVLDMQGKVEALTLTSGWLRGDNFLQQPQYNVVFGFLDPGMPKGVTITTTWEDGVIIHLTPDQDVFIAIHPGPGQADYAKVEFFDAKGELISIHERLK